MLLSFRVLLPAILSYVTLDSIVYLSEPLDLFYLDIGIPDPGAVRILLDNLLIIRICTVKVLHHINMVNDLGKYVDLVLIQIPRGYDFESFVKKLNYDHVDVYKLHGDPVYYCAIKTK